MKITFKREFRHADDGINIVTHPAGETIDVSESCAAAAIRTGAGFNPESAPEPEHEEKAIPAAPKNKAKK